MKMRYKDPLTGELSKSYTVKYIGPETVAIKVPGTVVDTTQYVTRTFVWYTDPKQDFAVHKIAMSDVATLED
jgi:hypothetical protein